MNLEKLYQFTEEITKENGAKYKESVLQKYKENEDIKKFLSVLLDPNIVFGIQMKKLEKAFKETSPDYSSDSSLEDMLEYVTKNNTGSNKVLETVVNYIRVQDDKYHDMLKKIFTKSLKLGVTANTVNKVWEGLIFQLKVMKSKSIEEHEHHLLDKEVIATVKLDGIRMIVIKNDDKIMGLSRSGKIMTGYDHILANYATMPNGMYDGELLYIHRRGMKAVDVRQKTASLANTKDGSRLDLEHVLFDFVGERDFILKENGMPYEARRTMLEYLTQNKKYLSLVPIVFQGVWKEGMKDKLLELMLLKGEEGLMVALADEPYHFKQTHAVQKVKPSYTIDLRVVDTYEGLTLNTQNELGGAIVKYKGFDLKVGNGWSKEERELYYEQPELLIGKIIEIGHSGESSNQNGGLSVNFPRFIRVRDDKDEESYD